VALNCLLFKRELFVGNLFAGFQNQHDYPIASFLKLLQRIWPRRF
jgi:hypothetical protein